MKQRDNIELRVIKVNGIHQNKFLEQFIFELPSYFSKRSPKIEVTKTEIPGLYHIENSNKQYKYKSGFVRVVGLQIWTGLHENLIKKALESKKIGYDIYPIDADYRSLRYNVRPFNLAQRVSQFNYIPTIN